jgi:hypothetical protein
MRGVVRGCVVHEIGQHALLSWRESAKISKLLLADLCCNTLKKSYEISVFRQKFRTYMNQKIIVFKLTYLSTLATKI